MATDYAQLYKHLTTHIIPGPRSISYFIPFILLPIALLIPPSILSRTQLSCIFLPLIYSCYLHSCLYGGGMDVISTDIAIWSTDLIALQDPRATYKRIHLAPPPSKNSSKKRQIPVSTSDSAPPTTHLEPYPPSLPRRLPWVLTLLLSIRLNTWHTADPYHNATQPPVPLTRSAFLRRCAILIFTSYFLLDIAAFYALHDPYFTSLSVGIDDAALTSLSSSAGPAWLRTLQAWVPLRILRTAVLSAHFYGIISLGGALAMPIGLLANAMGVLPDAWSPQSWPLFFGPFAAVAERGLRGLWGTWWHQTMRYPTTIPGRALAEGWGCRLGGLADYALRTGSAFGLSGWIHLGLVPPEPLRGDATTARWCIGGFFWVQAVGVGVEVVVVRCLRRSGFVVGRRGGLLRRVFVLGWVVFWLCVTVPILGAGVKELGYGRVYPVPFSLWNWKGGVRNMWS